MEKKTENAKSLTFSKMNTEVIRYCSSFRFWGPNCTYVDKLVKVLIFGDPTVHIWISWLKFCSCNNSYIITQIQISDLTLFNCAVR